MSAVDRAQFESSMLQFIKNEIETGMTFVSLAVGSQNDEKRRRNQQNARKAYDTARHFLEEHAAGSIIAQPDVFTGMSKLRDLLVQLGENVER